MDIISLRENPAPAPEAIAYFQEKWADEASRPVYENCITHALRATSSLPQWYVLEEDDAIIGCAGLIPNDFISRMDLWPWLCALFIEKPYRGRGLGSLLIERARRDAKSAGFTHLYLCMGLIGYYEK